MGAHSSKEFTMSSVRRVAPRSNGFQRTTGLLICLAGGARLGYLALQGLA